MWKISRHKECENGKSTASFLLHQVADPLTVIFAPHIPNFTSSCKLLLPFSLFWHSVQVWNLYNKIDGSQEGLNVLCHNLLLIKILWTIVCFGVMRVSSTLSSFVFTHSLVFFPLLCWDDVFSFFQQQVVLQKGNFPSVFWCGFQPVVCNHYSWFQIVSKNLTTKVFLYHDFKRFDA